MNTIRARMTGTYSTAKACKKPGDTTGKCYPLDPGNLVSQEG